MRDPLLTVEACRAIRDWANENDGTQETWKCLMLFVLRESAKSAWAMYARIRKGMKRAAKAWFQCKSFCKHYPADAIVEAAIRIGRDSAIDIGERQQVVLNLLGDWLNAREKGDGVNRYPRSIADQFRMHVPPDVLDDKEMGRIHARQYAFSIASNERFTRTGR